MSWLSEWIRNGKIRLPKKYNSVKDIRRALKQELTDEKLQYISRGIARKFDLPGISKDGEVELIHTVMSYGLKALMG